MKKWIIVIFVILLLLVFAVFYFSASVTPETKNESINSSENISTSNETWEKSNNSSGGAVSIPLKKPPFINDNS